MKVKEKVKKNYFLFGWILLAATLFLLNPEKTDALQNTAPQVGNNDQVCTESGRLYTIVARNSSYQLQLQKYSAYITDSDIRAGCLQEYVTNSLGNKVLQCRHYDGTNIEMTFTSQRKSWCKRSSTEPKFNEDGTLNENLLKYTYLACPVSSSNVDGIPVDEWEPKDVANMIDEEYILSQNLWKVTLRGLKGVSARLVNGTKSSPDANIKFVFDHDIEVGEKDYYKYGEAYGGDPILSVNGINTYIAVGTTPQSTNNSNAPISEGYVQNLYQNATITSNGDGTQNLTFYMSPGSEFYIQLVINNTTSLCHNTEAAHITGGVSVMVPGSVLTETTQCKNYTAWATSQNNSVIESLYKNLVPECYDTSNNVDYTKLDTYYAKIEHAQNILQSVLSSIKNASTTETTVASKCEFDATKNVQTYSYVGKLSAAGYQGDFGTYWDALCTETVNVTFDTPKALSAAGAAFEYPTTITVSRECKPYVVKEPVWKTQCTYTAECWGGPANHSGEAGAGPNKDFDSCIYDCDNGNYTQECIDSCYNEIYGATSDSLLTSFNFFAENYNNTEKTAQTIGGCSTSNLGKVWSGKTRLPLSSCQYDTGNAHAGGSNCTDSMCRTEHGVWYTYLDGCNANGSVSGTACYEVYTSSPRPNCIEVERNDSNGKWYVVDSSGNTTSTEYTLQYALQAYENEIQKANAEYQKLEAAMKAFKDNEENIGVSITDSNTGKVYNAESGYEPEIWYRRVENGTEEYLKASDYQEKTGTNPSLGDNGGAPVSTEHHSYPNHGQNANLEGINVNTWQVTKTYEVRLPEAFVSNVNVADYKYGLTNTEDMKGYTNGGNKYYTHIFSPGINDVTAWPNYTTVVNLKKEHNITENIKVNYSLGTWNQIVNSTIDCFYGIPDDTDPYQDAPDPNCDDENFCTPCGDNDICESGTIYVWRTIDLYNMFPANSTVNDGTRQPRWNWSSSAIDVTNQRYAINPPKVIDDIESKGDTIYGDEEELDYRIILTKENIKNLRLYNQTHGSYTDFEDMTCTYDEIKGVSICTSSLLPTQGGESEYMTMVDKGIAGCNNEQGEECIDSKYTITNGVDVNE